MKNKFKFLIYITCFMLFCIYNNVSAQDTVSEIKERGYISLATNTEFAPFEYKDGDEAVGIDIDIAKEIANRIGVDLKITDVAYDAIMLELTGENCDFAIAAMSYSEDKAKNADFSEPYCDAKQAIIVCKDSNITSGDELNGKKIGVHIGTTGDIYCAENFKDSEIFRYGKGSEAVLDMIHNRIDAVVIDDLPAKQLVNKNSEYVKMLDNYLFEEQYRIVVKKGNEELLSAINGILKDIKKDGTLDKIINSYISDTTNSGQDFWGLIYDGLIHKKRYKNIIEGLGNTFKITCGALIIGITIGSIVAFIKISKSKKLIIKILSWFADLYLAVIRGTPLVVQLFIMYYMVLVSTDLSKIAVAIIVFGINSGAYVSVIIKSGILSVDRGQYEAARSLGLNSRYTMQKVILPQALKNIIATLCNEFIALVKETSVAGFIGIMDLSRAGDIIRAQTLDPVVPLLTVALIYLLIVAIVSWLMSIFERRLRKSDLR